jgi:hypothetical protein
MPFTALRTLPYPAARAGETQMDSLRRPVVTDHPVRRYPSCA